MKDKKIIITGGAGFIGSNLAWKLCEDNEVIVIDDLSSGKIENIKDLIDEGKIKFVIGSVTDYKLLNKNFQDTDYVFHEAAIASVPQSFDDPINTNNVNINGTVNVFRAAVENNIKKVVWASSCAIYGDSNNPPIKENDTVNPLSPYALSKFVGECYAKIFIDHNKLPIVSLRYFNVYGQMQNPDGDYAAVIPIFIKKALKNNDLTIFGNGKQTRDFINVSDVVDANIFAAENNIKGVFNIGTGEKTSINSIAEKIIELSQNDVDIKYGEAREGDIKHSFSDISSMKSKGFEPKVNLDEGLKMTLKWFNNNS